jgi:hypothetical protein
MTEQMKTTHLTCLSPCVNVPAHTISFCSAVHAGLFDGAAGPDMSGITIISCSAGNRPSVLFRRKFVQWVSRMADLTLVLVLLGP